MDTQTKGNVCTMCGHEHKADGTCGCGMKSDMKTEGAKVCTMCGHEHKADGVCDCGCGKFWREDLKEVCKSLCAFAPPARTHAPIIAVLE